MSTEKLSLTTKPLTSPINLTNSLMTVSLYIDFLFNCLVVHLKPISPLSPSTSSLNPLPLTILKQIINTVATPLHQIICGSLSSGSVPPDFKKAVITPILKKPHLDSLSPSNYRPISTDYRLTSQSTLRSLNVLSPPNL